MKYLLLLFMLAPFCFLAQEKEIPVNFENQEVVYLLGDSVNIRKEPELNAEIVDRLPIGTQLKITDRSENTTTINGIESHWYKVRFNGKKEGFVWGGKIASGSFRSTKDPDIIFHFGLEKYDDIQPTFQVRVEKDHKQLQLLSFSGFGNALKPHTAMNYGNRGLGNVDDVIYVTGNSEFCGDPGGSVVLFWSGGKLYEVEQLYDMVDEPSFTENSFIFPADINGEKEIILFHETNGQHLDTKDQTWRNIPVSYEENKLTRYKWNGKALVKTGN